MSGTGALTTSIKGRAALLFAFLLVALAVSPGVSLARRAVKEPVDLLPDLISVPPMDVYFDDSLDGCDYYERVEEGAALCLRYETIFANFGAGPLELRYRVDQLGRDQQLRQRVFRSDGSFRELVADRYELHPAHGHFHYANFAMAKLWDSDETGALLGDEPVRVSRKAGFCITDGDRYWRPGKSGERTYRSPEACQPSDTGEGTISQVNGLSVGWADAYEASRTSQYIEITGLSDGYYILEVVVDPLDTLAEASEKNNSSSVWLLIEGDQARLLGRRA